MDNNSNYFYISGLLSFSLFGVIIVLSIATLFSVKNIDSFALTKDNFISISLDIPTVPTKDVQKIVENTPEPVASDAPSQDINVNDLFSDVQAKKIVPKETKPVTSKRLMEIQKKIKKVESNSVEPISEKTKESEKTESKKEKNSSSTANEVNEYLAKIQAIVYQNFNVPPNSQGNSIKTVIELNALGKVVDFRILTYSSNSELNAEVDKIRDRLRSVVFPINPQNKSSRTVVILISQE